MELVMSSNANTTGKLRKEPQSVQNYEHDSENCC